MTLVLSGERPVAAATLPQSPLARLVALVGKLRNRRIQHIALRSLLELDQSRLDDLGINRGDLFDAMHSPRPSRVLSERRGQRARS